MKTKLGIERIEEFIDLFKGKHFQELTGESSGTVEAFNRAKQRGDWEDLQKKGMNLLRARPDVLPEARETFLPILV
jgi:hypothetical protein